MADDMRAADAQKPGTLRPAARLTSSAVAPCMYCGRLSVCDCDSINGAGKVRALRPWLGDIEDCQPSQLCLTDRRTSR